MGSEDDDFWFLQKTGLNKTLHVIALDPSHALLYVLHRAFMSLLGHYAAFGTDPCYFTAALDLVLGRKPVYIR